MKKLIIVLIAFFCTGFVVFFATMTFKINKKNEQGLLLKQTLPNFKFYTLGQTLFDKTLITPNTPVVIIYFNTDCDHCHEEAKLIITHIKQFKNAPIIMVSPNNIADIKSFAKENGLKKYPQIIVLQDKNYQSINYFGNAPFPSTYIYNQKHKLVKEYHGEVKIEAITKYLP
jgi:peroxiredoxin